MKIHIKEDLNLAENSKVVNMLNKASYDKTSFTDIVRNADILSKNEGLPEYTKKQILDSTEPKHRKYKKSLPEFKPPEDVTTEDHFRTQTRKFLRKELDTESYREILKKNNIEDATGQVDKLLRLHDQGIAIKQDELILGIRKNKAEHTSHMHHDGTIILQRKPSHFYYMEDELTDRKLHKNILTQPGPVHEP